MDFAKQKGHTACFEFLRDLGQVVGDRQLLIVLFSHHGYIINEVDVYHL